MIKIVLIGMKGCGKSTVGKLLAERLKIQFIELDCELEKIHYQVKKEKIFFREIYQKYGQTYFRKLETKALKMLLREFVDKNYVLACGGGTPMDSQNRKILS
ncbi:AAA family ATPase, partial [Candidatus Gottesmanbacteria bacterium]|nr:AAA family ATPase [Candidatus Gottesmanbacteria bacterium]